MVSELEVWLSQRLSTLAMAFQASFKSHIFLDPWVLNGLENCTVKKMAADIYLYRNE